jgi:hypothetical protein
MISYCLLLTAYRPPPAERNPQFLSLWRQEKTVGPLFGMKARLPRQPSHGKFPKAAHE